LQPQSVGALALSVLANRRDDDLLQSIKRRVRLSGGCAALQRKAEVPPFDFDF
jgi:hypothetical protein